MSKSKKPAKTHTTGKSKSTHPFYRVWVDALKHTTVDAWAEYKSKTYSFWDKNNPLHRILFTSIAFIALIAMPLLSFDYGITWDEPEDREYFKEVLAYFQTFGEDKRCLDTDLKLHEHLVNYGPFVNLICAVANEYFSPFDIYETRHFIIALFGFLGIIFTGLLAKRIGNWPLAVLALLFMILTPTIFGHSMNNQKDIPFMAFYAVSLYYLFGLMKELPNPRRSTILSLGISIGILMSIRVGGLLMFAYTGLFVGLQFLRNLKSGLASWKMPSIWNYAKVLLLVFAIGYVIGILFWPAALQDPLNHPLNALTNFEKFGFVHIWELFEGDRYYIKDFPWYYLPKSMLITIPLFILVGLVAYVSTLIVFKRWKEERAFKEGLIAFVFVFPIAYIIYKESNVYSSWRHVLFVYPSLVLLAAIGWQKTIRAFKKPMVSNAIRGVLTGSMLMVLFWMFNNHPYQYIYYNELTGGMKGAYGNYELDYWCQSPKQAVIYLLEKEGLKNKEAVVASNNDYNTLQYYADKLQDNGRELYEAKVELEKARDDREQLKHYEKNGILSKKEYEEELKEVQQRIDDYGATVSKLRKIRVSWRRDSEWSKADFDYAIWTTRTLSQKQIQGGYFPPKGTIKAIEVGGAPIAAIVKSENKDLFEANHFNKTNAFNKAIPKFQSYQKYDPTDEEGYRNYGLALLQLGQPQAAKGALYKSIELSPTNYMAYNYLGFMYRQMQQWDSAQYCYEKCIEYKVNMSGAHDGLGQVLLAKGSVSKAKKELEQAIQYGSRSPWTYFYMGEALYRLGNNEKALDYYGMCGQLNKNFAQGYYRISQILDQLGDKKQAAQFMQKYREVSGQ